MYRISICSYVCKMKITVHDVTYNYIIPYSKKNVFVKSLQFYCPLLPYSHLDLIKTSYNSLSDSTSTVGYRMQERVLSLSSKSCTRRVSLATAFLSCVFSSKSFINSESLMESPGRKGTGCLECTSLKSQKKQKSYFGFIFFFLGSHIQAYTVFVYLRNVFLS